MNLLHIAQGKINSLRAAAGAPNAAAEEAQVESLKQQIDARSQSATAKTEELLSRERGKEAELRRQAQADAEAIAKPATDCERARDVCARFARLAEKDAQWKQYICPSDPCAAEAGQ